MKAMKSMRILINGKVRTLPEEWREEALLFVLREHFGLVAAKFGCGAGLCGACTVIVDGEATRSCITPAGDVEEKTIRTLEGLSSDDGTLHPLQQAWIEHSVPQCGYCQAGQIMSAVALLARNPRPDEAEVNAAMSGNLCRCGTYQRIKSAIRSVAETTS